MVDCCWWIFLSFLFYCCRSSHIFGWAGCREPNGGNQGRFLVVVFLILEMFWWLIGFYFRLDDGKSRLGLIWQLIFMDRYACLS
jgi:hypothetical protein